MVQARMAGTSHDPRERHLQMFRKEDANASSEASPWRKKGRGKVYLTLGFEGHLRGVGAPKGGFSGHHGGERQTWNGIGFQGYHVRVSSRKARLSSLVLLEVGVIIVGVWCHGGGDGVGDGV